jgi:hypothetical protein
MQTDMISWLHRVIHKSLRDFRSLRYSSWDGHIEGEHVNKGRDTPSFCPTLLVLDMSTLGPSQLTQFWQIPRHRRFLIPCPRHVLSHPPPSSETRRYATAPSTQKKLEILYLLIYSFLLCLSWLLRSRVWNFRRDLWTTLYIQIHLGTMRKPQIQTQCYKPTTVTFVAVAMQKQKWFLITVT